MIKIICVGKIKEKFFTDAVKEYEKRLSRYTKLEIIELNDYKGDNEILSLEKEKSLILNYINEKDYVITLEIEGEQITSPKFSEKIDSILNINPNITFIIGSSYGLHNDVKNRSNYKLSFSKMTFPHQLFRVILLEQIYRCFKILKNEKYHK